MSMFHFFVFDESHFIWNCMLTVTEHNKNDDADVHMFP